MSACWVITLIDSGSSRNFIDASYVKRKGIETTTLKTERSVIAIDGREIEEKISEKVTIEIKVEGKAWLCTFYVLPLGDVEIILGKEWLETADPTIGWKDLSISYKEPLVGKRVQDEVSIPEEFLEFIDLFQEEGFSELPEHQEFDCKIKLIEGAELPKPARSYPLSPAESKAIKDHLDKELKDGKIRKSNSPISSPCFFVKKADVL